MDKIISNIIDSKEFYADVKDYLHYGANVKLERFIVFSLSKLLRKQKHNSVLEKSRTDKKGKSDIGIDDLKIELKFHFDFDLINRVNKELTGNPSLVVSKKSNWVILPNILKDVLTKECDLFIWVVSERDIKSYSKKLSSKEICYFPYLEKHSQAKGNITCIDIIRSFSNKLRKKRHHSLKEKKLEFTRPFKTKLHFYIFKFN